MNGSRIALTLVFGSTVGAACERACGQGTWRVSVDSAGVQGNFESQDPSISADGRFVAFDSLANNLVAGDGNRCFDVFVHDRQTATTSRVSVNSAGAEGQGASHRGAISADGRFVVFHSWAPTLVAGDTNGTWDVFVHDRQTAITTRVSVDSAGVEGNGSSYARESISADGRYVAFESDATNLVPGDTNHSSDAFVHDRQTATTTRVSVHSTGKEGRFRSYAPSISADGRFVAFYSYAPDLVWGDTNRDIDVFVHDRLLATTSRVSVDSGGVEGDDDSFSPSISADGRYVAFWSDARNLVPGDTNLSADVFVHDRRTATTTRVSVDSAGLEANGPSSQPSISADGSFVAFASFATNLVAGDTKGVWDVFVHDRKTATTIRVSVDSAGVQGNGSSYSPSISADGRFVAFDSDATKLVAGDTNWKDDVFVHGPYLTLEAVPELVATGGTLAFTTWTGQPGGQAFLAVVDLNGTATAASRPITSGVFDPVGLWSLSATVPPGLSGNVVTFLVYGIAPTGTVESTNREVITFQ